MKCVLCDSSAWLATVLMTEPDKYEKWVGITDVKRRWVKCLGCGLWHHKRNYPLADVEKIYSDGYRNPDFREETIEQAFHRVLNNPSENRERVLWLTNHIDRAESLLDIGSGLGIFPYVMDQLIDNVHCVEENKDSIEFLNKELNLKCTKEIPDEQFDMVSLVHVLEHIEDPIGFLAGLHKNLRRKGRLFIEVPDAVEFEILYPTHDDFNSCHTHFYDISTLTKVTGRAGFSVTDIHREHYPDRNLSRIMAICQS